MSIYHRYAVYYNCLRYLAEVEEVKDIVSKCSIIDDSQRKTPMDSMTSPSPCSTITSRMRDENDGYDKQKDMIDLKHDNGYQDVTSANSNLRRDQALPYAGAPAQSKLKTDSNGEGPYTASLHKSRSISPMKTNENVSPFFCTIVRKSQWDKFMIFHQILITIIASIRRNLKRVEAEADSESTSLISHLYYEAARLNGSEAAKTPRMQRLLRVNWWCSDSNSPGSANGRCNSPLLSAFEPEDLNWEDQVVKWQHDLGRDKDEYGRRHMKI